jgi:tRNA(Arg) A34 adenosine deaminase TadA
MIDTDFMRLAINSAREAISRGQIPVGSVLVRDDKVLLAAHNTVWLDGDPTAHAEMNAIRKATKQLGNIALSGCTIYCTLEPCPMCLSASHWAKVQRLVYGAGIADAIAHGFSELTIPAERMVELGRSPIQLKGGVLESECRLLFDEWGKSGMARPY